MRNIAFSDLKLTSGYWKDLYDLCRKTTLEAVWDRFYETGRVDAFKCDWNEATDSVTKKPHRFWDSDVAKWIESAAYYMLLDGEDETLIARIEGIVDSIEKNITDDGYFNSYYLTCEPGKRFVNRDMHELYCTGHLLEAAIAYKNATGRDRFLKLMLRNIECIRKAFVTEPTALFGTPGHQELEIALLKLYADTGDKAAFDLAAFFLEKRGNHVVDTTFEKTRGLANMGYNQSHLPIREQKEAVGHSVRAGYLYTAMAMYAAEIGDEQVKKACLTIYDNIINYRMYLTGGVGSERRGEQFTVDYDLPNARAYTESCAAIALAFFANEMCRLDGDNATYGDLIERILYNGFRSSLSLDGDKFFYENPLEIPPRRPCMFPNEMPIIQRVKIFQCSCCPPNITRFIPTVGRYLYTTDESTIFVNQYMSSAASFTVGGKDVTITQETNYPYDGKVKITYHGHDTRIAVRVPGWCRSHSYETVKGFAYFDVTDGSVLELDFPMEATWMAANPAVADSAGKAALMIGPMVYCAEEVDNGADLGNIIVDLASEITIGHDDELDLPTASVNGFRRNAAKGLYAPIGDLIPVKVRFIPYFAFANRGESEMMVWMKCR